MKTHRIGTTHRSHRLQQARRAASPTRGSYRSGSLENSDGPLVEEDIRFPVWRCFGCRWTVRMEQYGMLVRASDDMIYHLSRTDPFGCRSHGLSFLHLWPRLKRRHKLSTALSASASSSAACPWCRDGPRRNGLASAKVAQFPSSRLRAFASPHLRIFACFFPSWFVPWLARPVRPHGARASFAANMSITRQRTNRPAISAPLSVS